MTQRVGIVGGGPVGGALACALASYGVPVTLVDKTPLEKFLSDETSDRRAIAVSPSSKNLLAAIGVWDSLEDTAEPILHIKTVHGPQGTEVSFDGKVGEPRGHIVPMSLLRQAIARRVQSLEIPWHTSTLDCFEKNSQGIQVSLDNGKAFTASLLVGADGKFSKVRELAGFETTEWPYGKQAIVCTYAHENDHQGIAWEIFLEEGPFALLPMRGKETSIVWTVQEDIGRYLKDASDEDFDSIVTEKMAPYLKGLKRVSPRWIYPIGVQFCETYIQENLALVGDAAHVMHPLAGQGVNMGFRDVAALAEVVVGAARLGLPLSSDLERYQQWRRFDNLSMLGFTDTLDALFSNGKKSLKLLREVGMKVMKRHTGLQALISEDAMGFSGSLPKLLQGQSL